MARVKGGLNAKKRHNRVLKLAKGYRGARSKQYRVAKQSVMRALTSSYAGRKERKRQFRHCLLYTSWDVRAAASQAAASRVRRKTISEKNERRRSTARTNTSLCASPTRIRIL